MQNKLNIFLFTLLILPIISSQTITVDYPKQVVVNEEFTMSIGLQDFEEGAYDVKIDILSGGVRIAKILNNEAWKSTYYYINEAIEPGKEKKFTLKIIQDFEKANIVIKIKNPQEITLSFEDYEIEKGASAEESSEKNLEEEIQKEVKVEEEPLIIDSSPATSTPITQELQVIRLNSKDIKNDNSIQENKEGTSIKKYASFGLMALCILVLILLFLQNKKDGLE